MRARISVVAQTHAAGLVLGALLLWCGALVTTRIALTGSNTYRFLLWNLVLAVVPMLLAIGLRRAAARDRPLPVLVGLVAVWLLFFPNAPYVLTDLLHLKPKPGAPLWFDLALLLSCAGTALALGYASLLVVHSVLTRRLGWAGGWAVVLLSLLLSGLGIYLGRYLRWNSWDVATRPVELLGELLHRVTHPLEHPRTWGVTGLFSGFLTLGYALLRAMRLPIASEPNHEG